MSKRETRSNTGTDREVSEQTRLIPMYKLILHNDDVNDMVSVTLALRQVLGLAMDAAYELMLTAHTQGLALAAVEPLEHAELHAEQLRATLLIVTIEPE